MIIFTGVAGSGKSVQGRMLADNLGYPWLSTGEFLRMLVSGDDRISMTKGNMLGDTHIIKLVQKILSLIDTKEEFILDGFPRSIAQADWILNQMKHGQMNITAVINLTADESVIAKRLMSRGRKDDNPEAIKKRFDEYQQTILPILDDFRRSGVQVYEIDADQEPKKVYKQIIETLEK
jgi:adenylate kinase